MSSEFGNEIENEFGNEIENELGNEIENEDSNELENNNENQQDTNSYYDNMNNIDQTTLLNGLDMEINFNHSSSNNIFNPNHTDLPNHNIPLHNRINSNLIQSYLNRYINNVTNIIREEFNFFQNNQEDVPIILHLDEFYKFPTGKYKDLKEKYNIKINQCGITLEDFQDDSKIVVLPCGHPFMKEEIFKWLTENSNRCPICRKESGIGYPKL